MANHRHRPRASDFDPPSHEEPRRSDHQREHPQRRPSPNYERGNQQQNSRRLTPEESLDRHQNHYRQEPPRQSADTGYRQGGRDDFFEKRRVDREHAPAVGLWPKSPTQAYGEEKKKKKGPGKKDERHRTKDKKNKASKSKHHRSDDSDSDDSDDHHRSHRKHKARDSHKKKKKKHSSSDSEDSLSSRSDSEDDRRARRRKEKAKSVDREDRDEDEEDVWMEKEVALPPTAPATVPSDVAPVRKESLPGPSRPVLISDQLPPSPPLEPMDDEEDAGEVGPMPYNHATGKAMDPKEFGRALRPGEGSAMAAFIEAGERIPRRGEIGLTGTEIEKFENVGYVMSGSRHRRMNAVRIRKENQVISAEEKRGILKMQAEEKAKREGQIISSFRELVDTKLQETGQS